MKIINFRKKTGFNILIVGIVCLFFINNVALALPYGIKDTLQVQSIFKPVLNIIGLEYETQLRVETAAVLAITLKDITRPFQDINSELDKWYSNLAANYNPFKGNMRILNVVSNPVHLADSLIIEVELFHGEDKGKRFRITFTPEDISDLSNNISRIQEDGSRVAIEEVSGFVEEVFPAEGTAARSGKLSLRDLLTVDPRAEEYATIHTGTGPLRYKTTNVSGQIIDTFLDAEADWSEEGVLPRQLGRKGKGFIDMVRAGLPFPSLAVISSAHVQNEISDEGVSSGMKAKLLEEAIPRLEQATGKSFGKADKPLLLAVRSSPEFSMPGELDTVYVGLTDEVLDWYKNAYGEEFASEIEELFLRTYAQTVFNIDEREILDIRKRILGEKHLREAAVEELNAISAAYKENLERKGLAIPPDPNEQLFAALKHLGVLWKSDKVKEARKANNVPEDAGMSILLQDMVFGNANDNSFSAVFFTKNPDSGYEGLSGKWIRRGLISDLVWGISKGEDKYKIQSQFQTVSDELYRAVRILDKLYKIAFELELSVEDGKLYLVQMRPARLSPEAEYKVLEYYRKEKIINHAEYISRLYALAEKNRKFLKVKDNVKAEPLTKATEHLAGAIKGKVALSLEAARKFIDEGDNVILLAEEEARGDITTFMLENKERVGIVTNYGNETTHEVVQARGAGIPALIGVDARVTEDGLKIIYETFSGIKESTLEEGSTVVLDGHTGVLFKTDEIDIFEEWKPETAFNSLGTDPAVFYQEVKREVEEMLRRENSSKDKKEEFRILLRLNIEAAVEEYEARKQADEAGYKEEETQSVRRANYKKHIVHECIKKTDIWRELGRERAAVLVNSQIQKAVRRLINAGIGALVAADVFETYGGDLYPTDYSKRPPAGADLSDEKIRTDIIERAKEHMPEIREALKEHPEAEVVIETYDLEQRGNRFKRFRIKVVLPGIAEILYEKTVDDEYYTDPGKFGEEAKKVLAQAERIKTMNPGSEISISSVSCVFDHEDCTEGVRRFFTVYRIPAEREELEDSAGAEDEDLLLEGLLPETSDASREVPEKIIKRSHSLSQQVLARVTSVIMKLMEEAKAHERILPVEITVDLSLIPKEDLEANMETWAFLILSCRELQNVSFRFEAPAFLKGKDEVPSELKSQIENAAGETEALAILKEKLKEKAYLKNINADDVDQLFKERINAEKKANQIEVPIMLKESLEWAREKEITLQPNQYPVALEEMSSIEDKGVAFRNFEAALAIALAQVSMVMAQARDTERMEEAELPRVRKNIITKLQQLYGVFFADSIILTEETLDNMIHPDSAVRMNLAITLALPPITRMPVQNLLEYHRELQAFLQAA